jgi:hypothetical protein
MGSMVLDRFRGGTICYLQAVRKRVSLPGEDDMKRQIRRILPGENDIGAFWQPQFPGEDDISEWPAAFTAPPQGKISEQRFPE